MNERQIKLVIIEKAELMARLLIGKSDVELRKTKDGVSVHKVNRSKVA